MSGKRCKHLYHCTNISELIQERIQRITTTMYSHVQGKESLKGYSKCLESFLRQTTFRRNRARPQRRHQRSRLALRCFFFFFDFFRPRNVAPVSAATLRSDENDLSDEIRSTPPNTHRSVRKTCDPQTCTAN